MKAKQTLNEEQELGAKKDLGVFNAPTFHCQRRNNKMPNHIFVQAERFYDARAFALRYLGESEIDIEPVPTPSNEVIIQIKWFGNMAASNNLHMRFRFMCLGVDMQPDEAWQPITDL